MTSASTVRQPYGSPSSEDVFTATSTSSSSSSSPRSSRSALASSPNSPSGSVSSFPSVSSSYFFSSGPASPPHPSSHSGDSGRDHTRELIIPSLTLPAVLRHPTVWGQTLGDLRIVIVGARGSGKTALCELLLDQNDDVVETGDWVEVEGGGRWTRASTDWVEQSDLHGQEKFEPARNVEVHEIAGYDHTDDPHKIIESIETLIFTPFLAISPVLHPTRSPTQLLTNLLASPSSPLFSALIFLLPSAPSPLEQTLLSSLAPLVPIVLVPLARQPPRTTGLPPPLSPPRSIPLSSFHPRTPIALRAGLFRTPEVAAALRTEAVERFLRWREVQRAVRVLEADADADAQLLRPTDAGECLDMSGEARWSKAQWEHEVELTLSRDVAAALRRRRPQASPQRQAQASSNGNENNDAAENDDAPAHRSSRRARALRCTDSAWTPALDPLHLPSLIALSLGMVGGLGRRAWRSVNPIVWGVLSGFCVGVGVGIALSTNWTDARG